MSAGPKSERPTEAVGQTPEVHTSREAGLASEQLDEPAKLRASAEGGQPVEPIGGSWVTCYAHFRPTSTPDRDIVRLGLLCGPENGMKLVGNTIAGDAGDPLDAHVFEAKTGECYRVFAVADATVADLALEVKGPSGAEVAGDHNADRWPVVNPDGPFCLLDGGKYTIRVRARQGRGRYAMQIWRLP